MTSRPSFSKRLLLRLPGSIRARLTLLIAAVIVPAVLLAGLLAYEAQRNQRKAVERQLTETARALSLVVDRQLGQSEALLLALASSPALASDDLRAFDRQARALIARPDRWITVMAMDGRHVVNTHLPWGAELPRTVPPLEFAPGLARGQTHVSNLITSAVQSSPVLSVVVPVMRDGRMVYALSLVLLPSSFSNILADQQFPPNWVAGIIDRDGTVLARNRLPEKFVGVRATSDIVAALRSADHAVVESVNLEGVATVAAFNKTPGFGWTVILGAPRAEVYASVRQILLYAALLSALLVAIGAALSAWLARNVASSVEALAAGARALGRGEIPEFPLLTMRETGQVADAMRASAQQLAAREAELKRLNDTLENRVQTRTAELADANQTLSLRNRDLQDFAHVASHDLQEPLRQIGVFSSILQEDIGDVLNDSGRHYLQRIQAATGRMGQLIRDILSFSSVTNHPKLDTVVDLDATLALVRTDLESRLHDTGARLESGILGRVQGNPVQMQQLLLNLVGNALKFRRPDVAPVIRVRTIFTPTALRLLVSDNGIGFDEKYAERIFRPFERLHARSAYEGTGIGLAIVRRIVERHAGTVVARSRPGEGSTFEVTLPIGRGETAFKAEPARNPEAAP